VSASTLRNPDAANRAIEAVKDAAISSSDGGVTGGVGAEVGCCGPVFGLPGGTFESAGDGGGPQPISVPEMPVELTSTVKPTGCQDGRV